MQLDFSALANADAWIALITFLYLDFLDATGTLFTMARLINENVPGFIDDKARFPRRLITLCVDGVCILVGSLLGTSPLTVVAESSVGIKEGGRTGITAFFLGCGFVVAMFFSPLFSSIPPYATGPALIVVGTLMVGNARDIDWDDLKVAFPSFLTVALMPLTYSIAYGVLAGILANIAMWLLINTIDMTLAVFGRDPLRRTPGKIFYDAFQCWRDAFTDFVPGVKAEWQGVFSNRVIVPPGELEAMQHAAPEEVETRARIADGNGDWDFQAMNQAGGPAPRVGPSNSVDPQAFRGVASVTSGTPSIYHANSVVGRAPSKGVDY